MKRFLLTVMAAIMLLTSASCGLMDGGLTAAETEYRDRMSKNTHVYPFYSSLNESRKAVYDNICCGVADHDETAFLGEYKSSEDAKAMGDWVLDHYEEIMFEQPDFFWVNPYECNLETRQSGNKYYLSLVAKYVIDEAEAESRKAAYNKRVDEIVRGAEAKADLFEKVLFVYDEILKNTVYDYALAESDTVNGTDRFAYGCLVDGSTVCSGYAMAFTSVMQKLGIENGVEFNSYDDFSIFTGHVWNYCKLDSDYYYFDLTWDDTGFDSEEFKPYIDYSHNYFGITKAELERSNYTLSSDAPTPECNGTKYNYYVHKGLNCSFYSFDLVKGLILGNVGQKYVALRFDNYADAYSAEVELMQEGRIYDIVPESATVFYSLNTAGTVLHIFFDYSR